MKEAIFFCPLDWAEKCLSLLPEGTIINGETIMDQGGSQYLGFAKDQLMVRFTHPDLPETETLMWIEPTFGLSPDKGAYFVEWSRPCALPRGFVPQSGLGIIGQETWRDRPPLL